MIIYNELLSLLGKHNLIQQQTSEEIGNVQTHFLSHKNKMIVIILYEESSTL